MHKVYLASWFASQADMRIRAEELRKAGIEITSKWIDESIDTKSEIKDVDDDYLRETARIDLEDILCADTVVLNIPSEEELANSDLSLSVWARGGRHFEAGFQYAMMVFAYYIPRPLTKTVRRLILVGRKENVFHYLDSTMYNKTFPGWDIDFPAIIQFETWPEALSFMIHVYTIAETSPALAATAIPCKK